MAKRKRNVSAIGDLLSGIDADKLNLGGDNDQNQQVQELREEVENLRIQLADATSGNLVPSDGVWSFGRFKLTKTAVLPPDELTLDEADTLGYALAGLDTAVQFWMGDWTNWYLPDTVNDNERGEAYKTLSERFGIPVSTLKNYSSVCRKIPVSLRRDTISFSHHKEIAFMPDELKGQEAELLEWADRENVSVRQLRDHIQSMVSPPAKATSIAEDNWLFASQRIPKVNNTFQKQWSKARNGDSDARQKLMQMISEHRKWLDAVVDSLNE